MNVEFFLYCYEKLPLNATGPIFDSIYQNTPLDILNYNDLLQFELKLNQICYDIDLTEEEKQLLQKFNEIKSNYGNDIAEFDKYKLTLNNYINEQAQQNQQYLFGAINELTFKIIYLIFFCIILCLCLILMFAGFPSNNSIKNESENFDENEKPEEEKQITFSELQRQFLPVEENPKQIYQFKKQIKKNINQQKKNN